jgi:hypothetical protein
MPPIEKSRKSWIRSAEKGSCLVAAIDSFEAVDEMGEAEFGSAPPSGSVWEAASLSLAVGAFDLSGICMNELYH